MGRFVSQIWPLNVFCFFFPTEEYTPLPHITYLAVVVFFFGIPEFCFAYETQKKKKKILLVASCSAKSCC